MLDMKPLQDRQLSTYAGNEDTARSAHERIQDATKSSNHQLIARAKITWPTSRISVLYGISDGVFF